VARGPGTLQRLAGTYQEDRLRNDWLHQLGARRDWATFNAEYPKFRMNDDRSVRCYALMSEFNSGKPMWPARSMNSGSPARCR
jgi:soluble lytic murein transglycosylase